MFYYATTTSKGLKNQTIDLEGTLYTSSRGESVCSIYDLFTSYLQLFGSALQCACFFLTEFKTDRLPVPVRVWVGTASASGALLELTLCEITLCQVGAAGPYAA